VEAKFAVIVVEGRVELVRPMAPTPIDHITTSFPVFRKVAIT
jgi:hypothetical protein